MADRPVTVSGVRIRRMDAEPADPIRWAVRSPPVPYRLPFVPWLLTAVVAPERAGDRSARTPLPPIAVAAAVARVAQAVLRAAWRRAAWTCRMGGVPHG